MRNILEAVPRRFENEAGSRVQCLGEHGRLRGMDKIDKKDEGHMAY